MKGLRFDRYYKLNQAIFYSEKPLSNLKEYISRDGGAVDDGYE